MYTIIVKITCNEIDALPPIILLLSLHYILENMERRKTIKATATRRHHKVQSAAFRSHIIYHYV